MPDIIDQLASCFAPEITVDLNIGNVTLTATGPVIKTRNPKPATIGPRPDVPVGAIIGSHLRPDGKLDLVATVRTDKNFEDFEIDDDPDWAEYPIKLDYDVPTLVTKAVATFGSYVIDHDEAQLLATIGHDDVKSDYKTSYVVDKVNRELIKVALGASGRDLVALCSEFISTMNDKLKAIYDSIDHRALGYMIYEALISGKHGTSGTKSMYQYEDPANPGKWKPLAC